MISILRETNRDSHLSKNRAALLSTKAVAEPSRGESIYCTVYLVIRKGHRVRLMVLMVAAAGGRVMGTDWIYGRALDERSIGK